MKKSLIALVLLAVTVLWNLLFPPGLQPGRNTIYCALDCGVGYFYVSRPDASWVPRPGFAEKGDYILTFVMQERLFTVERFHAGLPPDP